MAGFMKTTFAAAGIFAILGSVSAHALSVAQTPLWSISGAGEGIVITNCDDLNACTVDIEIACRGQGIGALVNIHAFGMKGEIPYLNDQVHIFVDGVGQRRQFTIGSYENGNTVLQFEILPGDPLLLALSRGRDYEIVASERVVQSGIFGAKEAIGAFIDGCGWRASYPNLTPDGQFVPNSQEPSAIVTMNLECSNEPRLNGLSAEMRFFEVPPGRAHVQLADFQDSGGEMFTPPLLYNDDQYGKSFSKKQPTIGVGGYFFSANFTNERKRADGVPVMDVNISSPNVGLNADCLAVHTGIIQK